MDHSQEEIFHLAGTDIGCKHGKRDPVSERSIRRLQPPGSVFEINIVSSGGFVIHSEVAEDEAEEDGLDADGSAGATGDDGAGGIERVEVAEAG